MDASAVELNFFMSLKYFSWIAAVIHQNISLVATLSNTKMKRIFIKITSLLNLLTDGRCCVSVSTYLVHMKQLRISYELIKPCDAMIKLIAFMEMWYLGATRSWWGLTNWNCCTMVARDKTQFARNVSFPFDQSSAVLWTWDHQLLRWSRICRIREHYLLLCWPWPVSWPPWLMLMSFTNYLLMQQDLRDLGNLSEKWQR